MLTTLIAGVATAALAAGPAGANTFEAARGGFQYGFLHPFGGLDHVLVMVAVGLW
ncbi:MAG: HupE/UreJ family protein, partial [Rhodospirillales bacterium]